MGGSSDGPVACLRFRCDFGGIDGVIDELVLGGHFFLLVSLKKRSVL